MANSPSSKKRARQQEVRRQRNASQRSMVRTYIKKVDAQIAGGNYDDAQAAYVTA
ncbi:30S ribosomal protein S20, partial [Oleiphilus sp. HI0067]